MTNNRFNGNLPTRSCLQILEDANLLDVIVQYKGHKTNKILETDKTKEIIL